MTERPVPVPFESGSALGHRDSELSWRESWRRLWTSPDPDLMDAGFQGEWLVASIRLLIVLTMLYVPLDHFLQSPMERGRQVVLWVAVAALAEALVLY